MSKIGKEIALKKHAVDVALAVIENAKQYYNNPIMREVGMVGIHSQAHFRGQMIINTPANRFNDDGTLKPYENVYAVAHINQDGSITVELAK